MCYDCSAKYLWIALVNKSILLKKGHSKLKRKLENELLSKNEQLKKVRL